MKPITGGARARAQKIEVVAPVKPKPEVEPGSTRGSGFDGVSSGTADVPMGGPISSALPSLTPEAGAKDALGLGPAGRSPGLITTRPDEDGTPVQMRDDGSVLRGEERFRPALELGAFDPLPGLDARMPLTAEDGSLVLLEKTEAGVRFRPAEDGPIKGTQGALVVEGGALFVRLGDRLHGPDGDLVGLVHGDQTVLLRGTAMQKRALRKSMRDSPLRKVTNDDGATRWANLDGLLVNDDGAVLRQTHSGKPGPDLYDDGEGRAFLVTRREASSVVVDLEVKRAPEGVLPEPLPGVIVGGALATVEDGIAFDTRGAPLRALGEAPAVGHKLKGVGSSAHVEFTWGALDDEPPRFFEVRAQDKGEQLWVAPDGAAGIINEAGKARSGAMFDPPRFIVHDGALLNVIAMSPDGRALVAQGGHDAGPLAFKVSRGRVRPMPLDDAPLLVRERAGSLDEVIFGSRRFGVACAPRTRADFTHDVKAALQTHAMLPDSDVFNLGQRAMLDALLSVIGDGDDKKAKRDDLLVEVQAGGGPMLDGALGADGITTLEAELGFLSIADDPFIVAREGNASPIRRRAGGFQMPAATHLLALFEARGDSFAPASVARVRAHFAAAVKDAPSRAWSELPRADALKLGPPDDDGVRSVEVNAGAERFEFTVGPRPEGEGWPSEKQVMAWLEALPLQSLRSLRDVRFAPPDFGGQARFDASSGALLYNRTRDFWDTDAAAQVTVHEVAGHGIELGDPLIYRLLTEARILDAAHGAPAGTDDAYGDTNLAESFAVGVQELSVDSAGVRAARPHFAALIDALFTVDGSALPRRRVLQMLRDAARSGD